jgi:hypothetical protein
VVLVTGRAEHVRWGDGSLKESETVASDLPTCPQMVVIGRWISCLKKVNSMFTASHVHKVQSI